MAIHDPTNVLVDVRDGIERLLRSRLCASTPAQLGYLAGLEGTVDGCQSILLRFRVEATLPKSYCRYRWSRS